MYLLLKIMASAVYSLAFGVIILNSIEMAISVNFSPLFRCLFIFILFTFLFYLFL